MDNNPVLIFGHTNFNDTKYNQLFKVLDKLKIPHVTFNELGGMEYKAPVIITHMDGLIEALIYCRIVNYIPKTIIAIYPKAYDARKYEKELADDADEELNIKNHKLQQILKDPNYKFYKIYGIFHHRRYGDVVPVNNVFKYNITSTLENLRRDTAPFHVDSFQQTFNIVVKLAYDRI